MAEKHLNGQEATWASPPRQVVQTGVPETRGVHVTRCPEQGSSKPQHGPPMEGVYSLLHFPARKRRESKLGSRGVQSTSTPQEYSCSPPLQVQVLGARGFMVSPA